MNRSRRRGFTLVELLVVIVIIGILAALLLPGIAAAIRRGHVIACTNNLSQLWKMQTTYMASFGKGAYPPETGGAFWVKLAQTSPPLLDPTLADIFDCPVSPSHPPAGSVEYRGPGTNVNLYGAGDPVGADLVGGHGPAYGGCVLRKSGDVMEYGPTEPTWIATATLLSP